MATPVFIPGKIFLLGEYLVLAGGDSVVAALKPPFGFTKGGTANPHPESPYGRFLSEFILPLESRVALTDPGLGAGFGGSTAELLAGAISVGHPTESIWAWYAERFPQASGVDLEVQRQALRGAGPLFQLKRSGEARTLRTSSLSTQVLVFSCPLEKKLKTHEALSIQLPPLEIEALQKMVADWIPAWEAGSEQALLGFTHFAEVLSRCGRETTFGNEIRRAFLRHPEVLGVKGCGAGLNDAFLVGFSGNDVERLHLEEGARAMGLLPRGLLSECLW